MAVQIYSDDGTLTEAHPEWVWCELLQQGMEKSGRPRHSVARMELEMEAAGFVDVTVVKKKQPIGPRAKYPALKRVGAMSLLSCESGMEAYSNYLFTNVLGMDADEAKKIISAGLSSLKLRTSHLYGFM